MPLVLFPDVDAVLGTEEENLLFKVPLDFLYDFIDMIILDGGNQDVEIMFKHLFYRIINIFKEGLLFDFRNNLNTLLPDKVELIPVEVGNSNFATSQFEVYSQSLANWAQSNDPDVILFFVHGFYVV